MRNSDTVRKRLLDAAKHLFATEGYDSVTVDEITRSADCYPRHLCRYFKGKEQLLEAAVNDALAELTPHFDRATKAANPADGLCTLMFEWARGIECNDVAASLVLIEGRRMRPSGPAVVLTNVYHKLIATMDQLLDRIRNAGRLRTRISNAAIRSALLGTLERLLTDRLVYSRNGFPRAATDPEVHEAIRLVISAFMTE